MTGRGDTNGRKGPSGQVDQPTGDAPRATRTARRRVLRIRGEGRTHRADALAVEEPLEIRLGGRALAVTMRTPGEDYDLIAGFLLAEGLATAPGDITVMRYCSTRPGAEGENVVEVALADGLPAGAALAAAAQRTMLTTSSCGICGKASLEAVRTATTWPVADDPVTVPAALLGGLPEKLRAGQAVFARTGGLHGAGLFSADGELLCVREDVGRHNAVDKVLGWALLAGRVPLRGTVLQVSGRASFELAQKAVMAGVPILSAVSAPSSLAVELAEDAGLTLAGFVRGDSLNVYAGEHRVT
jgi:FdhD protein